MKSMFLIYILMMCLISCKGGSSDSNSASNGAPEDNNSSCEQVGDECGGGLYVGKSSGIDLIITPSGCTDSSNPTCNGTTDIVTKRWNTTAYAGMPSAGGSSLTDGLANTEAIFASTAATAEAVSFCKNLVYGGFDDWYLPAKTEFINILNNTISAASTFNIDTLHYWTSSELTTYGGTWGWAYTANTSGGTENTPKDTSLYVRCIRQL